MSQLGTVYATKRRRRNGKSLKPPPKDGVTKSNPSKRHRERLNAELDLLASLLPFEQNILSKLDRLSILRLSVSYLRTKSYFQVVMHKDKEENSVGGGGSGAVLPHIHTHDVYRIRELNAFEHGLLDGDMFLQALNGFLMILTCDGEVFFATHSIESYLGFHQSDIVHQSVYELVHSEDREELQRQLLWNSFLPTDMSSMQLSETLAPDKILYLERSFTVRFRCLLDNTSGFLRLDIRGRIKILHGQNRKTEEPPLALFAYCTPFGPPSLLEIPHKENMFKSKHKLDFSLVSMDQKGKHVLGYSDGELINMGGYDLVHYDDLAYVASAHQELLKTGASGMIAYRYQKKDGSWQWLQTSSRLVYKNSKPDFVICTHRQLMDEEGFDLLGKRTMDFKVSYLDTGLASTYFSEADQLVVPSSGSPNSLPPPVTPSRPNRRYKTQLRDFLSTCRSKRKMQQQAQQSSALGQVTPPASVVEYLPDPAVAVAAAYSNLNPMYTTSPYATAADNIYMGTSVHSTNFYPVTENLFHQYRLQGVGGYYADYHHSGAPAPAYVTNGFLSYDGYAMTSKDDKWQDTGKYYSGYSSGYGSPTSTPQQVSLKTPKSSPHIMEVVTCATDDTSQSVAGGGTINNMGNESTAANGATIVVTPKVEMNSQDPFERQTVLMWGTQSSGIPINSLNTIQQQQPQRLTSTSTLSSNSDRSPQNTPLTNGLCYAHATDREVSVKWNGSARLKDAKSVSTTENYQLQHSTDSRLYSTSSHNTTSPQRRLEGSRDGSSSAVTHNTVPNNLNTVANAPCNSHSSVTALVSETTPPPPPPPLVSSSVTTAIASTTLQTGHNNNNNNNNNSSTLLSTPHHHLTHNLQHQHHPQQTQQISPHQRHQQQQQQQQQHQLHTNQQQSNRYHETMHNSTPYHQTHGHAHGHHHHHHHQHPHHHHHHAHHHHPHHHHHSSAASTANSTEILLSESQHQQQQQLLQLSTYGQPLTCNSIDNNATTTVTLVESNAATPSNTSPLHTQRPLPEIGSVLNGFHHSASHLANGTVTVSTTPYHQLAIIASPIVIATSSAAELESTKAVLGNGDPNTGEVALQTLHPCRTSRSSEGVINNSALRNSTFNSSSGGGSFKTRNTAMPLTYATNAYVIGTASPAGTCATATLSGLEHHQSAIDCSPLLTFSEVTNTLLNQ